MTMLVDTALTTTSLTVLSAKSTHVSQVSLFHQKFHRAHGLLISSVWLGSKCPQTEQNARHPQELSSPPPGCPMPHSKAPPTARSLLAKIIKLTNDSHWGVFSPGPPQASIHSPLMFILILALLGLFTVCSLTASAYSRELLPPALPGPDCPALL